MVGATHRRFVLLYVAVLASLVTFQMLALEGHGRPAAPVAGPGSFALGPAVAQAAMSGSPSRRSFCSASRSSWRTRSAEIPCFTPMSASLCCRPSVRP